MMAFPYHGLSRIPSLPYPVHPESGNKARIGGAATWFYRDETLLNSLLFWIYPLVMTNIANRKFHAHVCIGVFSPFSIQIP